MSQKEAIQQLPHGLIDALREARHIAILTGAGISAESGLSTFRDAMTGIWSQYRPQDLATRRAFQRDPSTVWLWYASRREKAAQAQPNAGHLALVEMERHVLRLDIITQNVDSLHQRAGSKNVTELHGNISRVKCFDNNHAQEVWAESDDSPPCCTICGSMLRPDVVWFGEMLPEQAFRHAVEAAKASDLFLSIGTSGVVEPAASLVRIAQQSGAVIAIINLDVVPLESEHLYHLNGQAGTILPRLVQAAWPA